MTTDEQRKQIDDWEVPTCIIAEIARQALDEIDKLVLDIEMHIADKGEYLDENKAQAEEIERLKCDIQTMVNKAADKSLDGYRELGARAAAAENKRDDQAKEIERLREALELIVNDETVSYTWVPYTRLQRIAKKALAKQEASDEV